jgi:hypothetical protein
MNGTAREMEHETPVIFTWADREGSSWWLAAFIFLSFLLHSSAFFLFQGKNPAAPRTVRTAPLVQFLSASDDPTLRSPENDALLQWIALHDPALVAKVQAVEPKGLLNIPYHPSFQVLRTQPLGAPPDPPVIQIPPARDPLALIRSVEPSAKPGLTTPGPQPTQLLLPAPLQSRAAKMPVFSPGVKSTATVQPTVVLVGVNGDGEKRFAFVQQGCGDAALDADALNHIRKLSFTPSGDALLWGRVTIEWGDDATTPAPPR